MLGQVSDKTTQGLQTPPPEEEEVPLSLATPTEDENEGSKESSRKKAGLRVVTDEISVPEVVRECVISLSSPLEGSEVVQGRIENLGGSR